MTRRNGSTATLRCRAGVLLAVCAFVLVAAAQHTSAAPTAVRVGAYANPPKIDRGPDGEIIGFWPDLVDELAAAEGWQITWVWGSWSEGLERLAAGEIDVMPDVAHTPERARRFVFSDESVLLSWTRLYVPADDRSVQAIPDLAGLRIAALAGSVNLEGPDGLREQDAAFDLGCTILELPDYHAVFLAVEEGRADACITNRNYGNLLAGDSRLLRTPIIFQPTSLCFAFAPNAAATPDLVAVTDRWLAGLKQSDDSVYYDLLEKYFEAGITEREVEVLPGWAMQVLRVAGLLAVVGLFSVLFLRRAIRRRTVELEVAHADLVASEFRYGEIFNATSDAIFIHDAETGVIVDVNRAMLEMYGCTREEAPSLTADQLSANKPPYTTEDALVFMKAAAAGADQVFEWKARRLNGEEFWVEVSLKYAEFRGKHRIIAVVRDIRDRRRAEGEMLKNAKLQSLSVLAGGIAHDFNNLLTAVLGNVSLAMEHLASDGPAVSLLQDTEIATLRARGLTQQLLTFARGGDPVRAAADVDGIVRDATGFVLRGSRTSCEFEIPKDLWPADIDAGQIGQVVQNLVINARQAMAAGGGRLVVTCANIHAATDDVGGHRFVRIIIVDDGPGIGPQDLERVFDPYFTTRSEGSGLGLAICHSIVTKHGGFIAIDSVPEQGTTVTIDLPAAEQEVATPDTADTSLRRIDKRVLIMDDDTMVRELLARMLKHFGCRVDEAGDGAEAVELYRSLMEGDDPIDLVVMDLTIPGGMGGLEAMQRIRAFDPAVRAIVSSGYSNDPVMAHCREHGFNGAIVKPYRLEDLNAVVAEALA